MNIKIERNLKKLLTSLLSAYGDPGIYEGNKLYHANDVDKHALGIGEKAQIDSVTFSDGVTRIGWGAFEGCSSLASITIPEGVTSIGEYAFAGCSALNNITIPASVTSIEGWAFWGCRSLESITISEKFYEGKDKAKENARMKIHATCKVHYSE